MRWESEQEQKETSWELIYEWFRTSDDRFCTIRTCPTPTQPRTITQWTEVSGLVGAREALRVLWMGEKMIGVGFGMV